MARTKGATPQQKPEKTRDEYIGPHLGAQRYHMSLNTFVNIARDAGALITVRGKRLINVRLFEDYIESFPYIITYC